MCCTLWSPYYYKKICFKQDRYGIEKQRTYTRIYENIKFNEVILKVGNIQPKLTNMCYNDYPYSKLENNGLWPLIYIN